MFCEPKRTASLKVKLERAALRKVENNAIAAPYTSRPEASECDNDAEPPSLKRPCDVYN